MRCPRCQIGKLNMTFMMKREIQYCDNECGYLNVMIPKQKKGKKNATSNTNRSK